MYKDKETATAAYRRRKAANPEYFRKMDARNYLRRKERKKAIVRDYRMRHPEKIAALAKKYREENLDKITAYSKAYCQSHREQAKANRRQWEFGLSQQEYSEMLETQGGKCAICFRHHSEFKSSLAVDHCHKTGIIRMLLCTRCNPMLGYALDNAQTLRNAAAYIELHQS